MTGAWSVLFCIACTGSAALAQVGKAMPASATKSETVPLIVAQTVRVAPGALSGHIVEGAARRPLAAYKFGLTGADGKQVAELETTADGTYQTPSLAVGSYTLNLGQGLTMALVVAADSPLQKVDIVLPQQPTRNTQGPPQDPAKVPAAPGGESVLKNLKPPVTAAPVVPGLGAGTWALIAGGAATAVAVPVAASQGGGSSENPVSGSGLGIRR